MKIFINETNCNLNNKKEIIAGLLIFFLPIIAFLRPYNFIQLNLIDIKFLFVGHFLLLLLIASISFLVSKFSNFKFSFLLFLFCTFIYLQFFFDFFSLLSEINHIFIFILFEFLCLVLITFVYKFKVAFLRFTLIYSTLLILYHISNIIIFSFDYNKQFNLKNINEQFDSKNLIEISNNKKINKKNVYFIVFDGMMSLDTASSIDIVNEEIELTNLKNLKLRYINNSFSNYSASWTNLAAIFKLDYPIKEKDLPPKNLDNFFPFKLYTSKNTNLIKYLRKVNTTFFWGGNRQSPCREINVDILCMQKNKFNNNILNLLSKFYFNTPLRKFFFLIYKNNNSIYPSDLLTSKNLELDKSQNKFYFIHNLSPHTPYIFNSDCTLKDHEDLNSLNGYKNNYNCALKKIKKIIFFLNQYDPNAIVVFQGDHGWNQIGMKLNDKQKINFQAKIFSAIKAPKKCFNKFGTPNSSINTIRFVLNCAYGYSFKKLPNFHYVDLENREVENKTKLLNW